jgi:hypothetical protein
MAWHGPPFDPIAAASRLQPQILERLRWHRLGSAAAPSTMGRSAHSCPRAAALQNDLLEDREREPVRASATVVCVRARVGARARVLHLIFGIESNRRAASAARSFKYSSTAARTRATCAPTCDIGRRRQQVRCWPAAVAWRPSDAACCAMRPHVGNAARTDSSDRSSSSAAPPFNIATSSFSSATCACARALVGVRGFSCVASRAHLPLEPRDDELRVDFLVDRHLPQCDYRAPCGTVSTAPCGTVNTAPCGTVSTARTWFLIIATRCAKRHVLIDSFRCCTSEDIVAIIICQRTAIA